MATGLLRNCRGFWELEETSGTRVDRHAARDLTDINTVGSATGKVGTAADFENGNNEELRRNSETALQGGDHDFWVGAWARIESTSGNHHVVISKTDSPNAAGTNAEYSLRLSFTEWEWRVFGLSSVAFCVYHTPPALATWYLVTGSFDAGADRIRLSVDKDVVETDTFTSTPETGNAKFIIGNFDGGANDHWDGLLDQAFKMDRAPVAHEIAAMHNAGAGRSYKSCMRPYRRRQIG